MHYLIHQQSGGQREVSNLQFLRQIADECFIGDYKIIITDNSIKSISNIKNITRLPCDNEFREFSGWMAGINYLRKYVGIEKLSGILFSNETLLKHRPFDHAKKLAMINAIKYSQAHLDPVMAGDIDLIRAQGPYHQPSIDSFYISTYFCFVNNAAVHHLNIFLPEVEIFDIINPIPNNESVLLEEKRLRAPNHYEFIEEWLYKKHSGPKWYAHEALSEKNYKKMSIKFISIIIEHGISQKFVAEGGVLVDYKKFIKRTFI